MKRLLIPFLALALCPPAQAANPLEDMWELGHAHGSMSVACSLYEANVAPQSYITKTYADVINQLGDYDPALVPRFHKAWIAGNGRKLFPSCPPSL